MLTIFYRCHLLLVLSQAHAGYLAGWLGIGLRVEVKGEMGDKFTKRLGLNTMNLMLGMCFISKTRCWAAKRSDLDK